MKKISLIVIVFLIASPVFSQVDSTATVKPAAPAAPATPPAQTTPTDNGGVRLGLELSPLISWFGTSGNAGRVESDGSRFNIRYGLNVDFPINTKGTYYFSTGLFVSNMGGTLVHDYYSVPDGSTTPEFVERTADYRINYLTIPINVMLRSNEIGYLTYFVRIGFDAGFSIRSMMDYTDKPLSGSARPTEDADAGDYTELMRMGLHLEIGAEYNISGNMRIYGGLEYNNGINDVFNKDYRLPFLRNGNELVFDDNGNVETDQPISARMHSFSVNLGIYF